MSQDYPSAADSYNLCHPIGRGATADVWHAICTPLKKEVAIKIIDLESCPNSNLEEIRVCFNCNIKPLAKSIYHYNREKFN